MPSGSTFGALQSAGELFKRLTTIQPKEAKVTVGLDVGSSAVKAVALGPKKGSLAKPIIGQNIIPLDSSTEVDPAGTIKQALGALQLPTRTVNLSVSGQWVIMRIVEMPTLKPAEMRQALPFEAQRYLPFNLQDVVIDGVALGSSEGNKSWVLIVACKKELIERRVDWVKRAGYDVNLIDVDALAIANAFLSAQTGRTNQEQVSALVDIGAQLSNLVIFKGDAPYLVRDVPWGGEKLIRQVAEQLHRQPEEIKALSDPSQVTSEMTEALKTATEPLITELQLSFDYFENRFGRPPDKIWTGGGMSQFPGMIEAIKSHLTQTVEPWVPVKGLSGQFAVAYGLALRAN